MTAEATGQEHGPTEGGRTLHVCSVVGLGLALAASAGAFALMLRSALQFRIMFEEMGIELPLAARLWPLYLAALPALAVAGILKEALIRRPELRLMINGLHLSLVALLFAAHVVALFLPMMELMQKMGG
jgi:hypothetical protein